MISARVKKFLKRYRVSYRLLNHKRILKLYQAIEHLQLNPNQVLSCALIKGDFGQKMVVIPASRELNLELVTKKLSAKASILPHSKTHALFKDCESGLYPPFGELYGLKTLLDKNIPLTGKLYFRPGSYACMLEISSEDFWYLSSRAQTGFYSMPKIEDNTQGKPSSAAFMPELMPGVYSLPKLPLMAKQILKLVKEKKLSTETLVKLLSEDNGLNQQLMRYAEDAFVEGLPSHALSHLIMGDTASSSIFSLPEKNPLSLKNFWQHSLFCAELSKNLVLSLKNRDNFCSELSYLCGMLHNFGFLVFAKLFPPEFKLLDRWISQNPHSDITLLEKKLLGMGQAIHLIGKGHAELGARLMQFWEMPEEIVTVTQHHHEAPYQGKHDQYVAVVQLANQSLRKHNIGDGQPAGISEKCLEKLSLTEETVLEQTKKVLFKQKSFELLKDPLSNSENS